MYVFKKYSESFEKFVFFLIDTKFYNNFAFIKDFDFLIRLLVVSIEYVMVKHVSVFLSILLHI